jgi:hypothetical protein
LRHPPAHAPVCSFCMWFCASPRPWALVVHSVLGLICFSRFPSIASLVGRKADHLVSGAARGELRGHTCGSGDVIQVSMQTIYFTCQLKRVCSFKQAQQIRYHQTNDGMGDRWDHGGGWWRKTAFKDDGHQLQVGHMNHGTGQHTPLQQGPNKAPRSTRNNLSQVSAKARVNMCRTGSVHMAIAKLARRGQASMHHQPGQPAPAPARAVLRAKAFSLRQGWLQGGLKPVPTAPHAT